MRLMSDLQVWGPSILNKNQHLLYGLVWPSWGCPCCTEASFQRRPSDGTDLRLFEGVPATLVPTPAQSCLEVSALLGQS